MKKALFIIGGMGPEASVYLYKLLIDMAIKKHGAKNNVDFPEIILYSIPVPDFISDNKNLKAALAMLKQRIKFASNKSLCIAIACNTAHILLPELQKVSKVPFISMIDKTVEQVNIDYIKKVGLLGTPSTLKYGLYQTAFGKYGIDAVIPSKKRISILEKVIRNVLKGKVLSKDTRSLEKIADDLKNKGVQAIVLGCTELPLVFPKKYTLPVYNSSVILAEVLLQTYYQHLTF